MQLSREEYHAWLEQQPHGRFERVHGEVVELSPELIAHARLKAAIWLALRDAIEATGLTSCEALGDGPTVQVADGSDYEPDAVVTFGEPAPNDSIFVPNPLIVVEVLSRGTKKVDTTEKLFDYFTVPSIVHYLIFSVNQRKVVHHRRLDGAGNIATHVIADSGDIVLEPPGIAIALEPLYRRVL